MASLSGRPATSNLVSQTPSACDHSNPPTIDPFGEDEKYQVYVPNVFDFIGIMKPVEFGSRYNIRPTLLEPMAVDQSVLINHGASFTTYRKAIPAPSANLHARGLVFDASKVRPAEQIVYKVARVAFTRLGEPTWETRHAMKALMMELHILRHKPLESHPNIIRLLGLAWGSNNFDPSHRLPVLTVEFADYGTLADLQQKEDLLPILRSHIALDIGEGLRALHQCGIIHGDVKSENVLIFSHPHRKYQAKVSDFGSSMVEDSLLNSVYVGGTRPWKAPETKSPVSKESLKATDVYSFGLLLWRLATDGKDPFRFWTFLDLHGEPYYQTLELLKENDQPVIQSSLDIWFIPYLIEKQKSRRDQVNAKSTVPSGQDEKVSQKDYTDLLDILDSMQSCPDMIESRPWAFFLWTQQDRFYGTISAALLECLSFDPEKRSLDNALDALQRHPKESSSHDATGQANGADCFAVASFCINAYGTDYNPKKGMNLLMEGSKKMRGAHLPMAYAYRVCKALNPEFMPDEHMVLGLLLMALSGSRTALADLKQVAPDRYPDVKHSLSYLYAGVGANFFLPEQMLGDFDDAAWNKMFNGGPSWAQDFGNMQFLSNHKVNIRGDRSIHMAAACGKFEAIEAIRDRCPTLSINQLNDQGETPLLCACRAGQKNTVLKLLDLGSDASICTPMGESCLHWLLSFEDDDIQIIGKALIMAGAPIREQTLDIIHYSIYPAMVDIDLNLPGTPLFWAVHSGRCKIVDFLLQEARDASICMDAARVGNGPATPLQMASAFHHTECITLMIDAMRNAGMAIPYDLLLIGAVQEADPFSMMLRHGPSYKRQLWNYLDFCLKETRTMFRYEGLCGPGWGLLYLALKLGQDEVVKYVLSSRAAEILGPVEYRSAVPCLAHDPRDINAGYEQEKYTPLYQALRWNRREIVELLIANGADHMAVSTNPFTNDPYDSRDSRNMDWNALHVLASTGHRTFDPRLVSLLVDEGVPVDGEQRQAQPSAPLVETPFLLAILNDAWGLAAYMADLGADINALRLSSGSIKLDYPTTVLGHVIAAAAQHSAPRIQFLFGQDDDKDRCIAFIVEPERRLSALHRAAWAYRGVYHRSWPFRPSQDYGTDTHDGRQIPNHVRIKVFLDGCMEDSPEYHANTETKNRMPMARGEYDMAVNRETMRQLLQRWNSDEYLNFRSNVFGRTALHLAVDARNLDAVKLLLERNADTTLADELGLTPLGLVQKLLNDPIHSEDEKDTLTEIISVLQATVPSLAQ
ncbi:hypothetical protein CBS147346_7306 [Aspergillus niger]|nr:hypothetical protein CBS147346_7306 [Aspergillus niger]